MNELELEKRITRIEERGKSNTHRLDKLEPIIEEIHTMSVTMVQLVEEVKHTNDTVTSLDEKVDRMDSRVDEMEKIPGKEWKNVKGTLINTTVGALIAFFAAGLIWAAVQAF